MVNVLLTCLNRLTYLISWLNLSNAMLRLTRQFLINVKVLFIIIISNIGIKKMIEY